MSVYSIPISKGPPFRARVRRDRHALSRPRFPALRAGRLATLNGASKPGIEASVMVIVEFRKRRRAVDNFLPKSEDGVSLVAMPDRTLAMSTPMIPWRAEPFRPARRLGAGGLRVDGGRPFDACARERTPLKIKLAPGRP